MRVILAGYNVDSAVLDELKKNSPSRDDVTPETLSASYARISRDPRPVDELRAAARAEVDRTRRSNQSIIFKMGHHSVAEHAVFNFDIIGVSRLAIEEIERFRLMSFTEKSQRYITLGEDFVVPDEIKRAGREALFVSTVKAQNALYHRLYARLKPFVFAKHRQAAADPRNAVVLDGWAKEDARYVVSLATEGQLGLTANARSLELLIRRFAASGLAEIKALNARLFELAKEVAPSIILFTEPSPFDAETYKDLAGAAAGWPAPAAKGVRKRRGAQPGVLLPEPPPMGTPASSPPFFTRSRGFPMKTASRGPERPLRPPGRTSSAGPSRAWSSTISRPGNSSTPISFTTSCCRRRVSPSSSGTGWPV